MKEAARRDFANVHENVHNFEQLVKTFNSKLDEQQKQRCAALLQDLNNVVKQVDEAVEGNQPDATQSALDKLLILLKNLEKQLAEAK